MGDTQEGTSVTPRPASGDGESSHNVGARLARLVWVVGCALIGAGMLVLFYTVYLLWGTSGYTRVAQDDLARQVAAAPLIDQGDPLVQAGQIPAARPASVPQPGDALFTIVIPKIGLRSVVVEGVERDDLKKGPGRFPDCADVPHGVDCLPGSPWPGEEGNVAISGHRTTFGAPFFRLDELEAGDVIAIESGPARYRYTVTEKRVVHPSEVEVVENRGRDEITLTTCHPRFSAAQRLVVHASYAGPELIVAPGTPSGPATIAAPAEQSLVPASPPAVPQSTLVLVALAAASLLGAMALSKRFRAAALWSAVLIVSCIGLWTTVFPQVVALMPANY